MKNCKFLILQKLLRINVLKNIQKYYPNKCYPNKCYPNKCYPNKCYFDEGLMTGMGLWLHGVFREILSLIFEFQPDLTLARIMCCQMANNTLKILWCSHRKIFLSMFGHFTTLCMKGLRSIPSKPTLFLKSSLHLFQKRCLICLHLLSS